MPDIRVARSGFEALGAAHEAAKVTRQGIQVATEVPGASSAAVGRVTRAGIEVLGAVDPAVNVTRQGIQVASEQPGANSAAVARVARAGVEVLGQVVTPVSTTRQGIQVATAVPGTNATAGVRTTRYGIEVLAKAFIPLETFPLPANWELFLHNWGTACQLESAYSTDISASAEDLAEERVGLLEKPYRSLSVEWSVKGSEEANRFLVEMRRLVDATTMVPIYPDAVDSTQTSAGGSSTLYGDFSRGRFFPGGRVVAVRMKPTVARTGPEFDSYQVFTIGQVFPDRITLTTTADAQFLQNRTVIMPLMQCHPQTELTWKFETNDTLVMSASFDEVYGPQALPPTSSDLPPSFDNYAGHPILSTVPQWSSGVESGLVRTGELSALGRGRVIFQRGSRGKARHNLVFVEDRQAAAWNLIRFFDSRRGRLRPFWFVDLENVWTTVAISGSFFTVAPLGTLANFQSELDYMGVVFSDGKAAVRAVSLVELVSGNWRIALDSALPAGYSAADVVSFGRARLCRMESDALEEEWSTTNVCSLDVPVIELLAEQEVTTDG